MSHIQDTTPDLGCSTLVDSDFMVAYGMQSHTLFLLIAFFATAMILLSPHHTHLSREL